MDINYENKSSFEFFESIYDRGVQEVGQYVKQINAHKFHYFRIYQGGKYFLFSSQKKYLENIFTVHEQSPIFMDIINNLSKSSPFFCSIPTTKDDLMIKIFYELGWSNHLCLYYRHQSYVDAVCIASDISNNFYSRFCLNNTSLLKNLYWLIREKMKALVPFDQPGVLSQFRNGADISYKPPDELLHLPELEQKIQDLLEDMSRKKLSLTPREWEVCKGLVRGETAKETGRILGVNHRTVEDHLGKVYQKFGEGFGYKPTRSQVIRQLYQTFDKDLVTRTLWEPILIK